MDRTVVKAIFSVFRPFQIGGVDPHMQILHVEYLANATREEQVSAAVAVLEGCGPAMHGVDVDPDSIRPVAYVPKEQGHKANT
jgi:hypothetical protein